MKASERALRPSRMALIVGAAALLPLAAHAQGTSMADMQSRYKEDLQRCESLTDPESQRTCRREAAAALQEARRDRLVTGQSDTAANAAARCQRLPAGQREDCERLMSDSAAVEHGSISGGGVLRELTITVPADPSSTGGYGAQPAPGTGYGSQPAPGPGYGSPPAPASSYGTQTAPGSYQAPPPAGTYGTQPAPGSYQAPPATGGYGSQPMPSQ